MQIRHFAIVLPSCIATFVSASRAFAGSPVLNGEEEVVVYESLVMWFIRSLGLFGVLTLVAGLMSFVFVCIQVISGRHPLRNCRSYLFWPTGVSVVAAIVRYISIICTAENAGPNLAPFYMARAFSDSIRLLQDGIIATVPAAIVYAIAFLSRMRRPNKPEIPFPESKDNESKKPQVVITPQILPEGMDKKD